MTRRRRKRTTTLMKTDAWGIERHPGRRPRRAAASGGSIVKGFIVGVKALWATPAGRKGKRKGRKVRTVRRRS